MRSPHLLRVEEDPSRLAPVIDAARALGLRVGWLELGVAPPPVSEPLESAACLGVLRAVMAGPGRTVAVKPLRGQPVLRDVLREHFQGCALVLVRGEIEAPVLRIEGADWIVAPPGTASRTYTPDELAEAFRKPNPWNLKSHAPHPARR